MKIILDTNVFVSGVFFSGPPFQILQAWRDEKVQLVVSTEILDEYRRVGLFLAEEHPLIDLMPILDYLIQHADVYSVPPLPERICEDPDDDKFFDLLFPGVNFGRSPSENPAARLRRRDGTGEILLD